MENKKTHCKALWDVLVRRYDPKPYPTPEMAADWLTETLKYDRVAIDKAFEHTKRHENRFPTLGLWLDYCHTFQMQITEEANRRQKEQTEQATRKFFESDQQGVSYGSKCCLLIRQALGGDITREEFVERMKALQIPHLPLVEYYQKHGLDMQGHIADYIRHVLVGVDLAVRPEVENQLLNDKCRVA